MASDFAIRLAARIVRNGGIIAYPTDTIYGLGCDPLDARAVDRVNRLKKRPVGKHCILLASNIDQLTPFIELDAQQRATIDAADEPTSWVIEARDGTPDWLVSEHNTIAVRVTDDDNVTRLCNAVGGAIISTSANPSGSRPAASGIDLHRYFHHSVDMILLAEQPSATRASKLIRLCDNHILRE